MGLHWLSTFTALGDKAKVLSCAIDISDSRVGRSGRRIFEVLQCWSFIESPTVSLLFVTAVHIVDITVYFVYVRQEGFPVLLIKKTVFIFGPA